MTVSWLIRTLGLARVSGFFALIAGAGFLEVAGVFLLYLFGLSLATGLQMPNHPLASHAHFLPDLTTLSGLLYVGLIIIAVKLIHWVVVVRLEVAAFRMQFDVSASITEDVFSRYLREPFLDHLRMNNAIRVAHLTEEMDRASRAIGAVLRMTIHGLMLLLVAALLLIVDWRASVAGALLLSIFAVVVRRQLLGMSTLGQKKSGLHRSLVMSITEPLRNLRAVRVAKAEAAFETKVHAINHDLRPLFSSYTKRRAAVLPTVEVGILVTIVGILALFLWMNLPIETALASMVLVLVGATRMLPNFLQVAMAMGDWWFHRNALHEVVQELESVRAQEDKPPARQDPHLEALAELQGVSFGYEAETILDCVDLSVPVKARIGIVGPSGSGKTTLIDILIGLLPAEGSVVHRQNLRIGYVSQHVPLLDGTVLDNVLLGAPTSDLAVVVEAVKSSGLVLGATLEETLSREVGEGGARLSGGQRQRLSLARALAVRPHLLVLDEPTASLDESAEKELIETLSQLDLAMVIVTHRPAPLRLCDCVHRLQAGKLVPEPMVLVS